MGQYYVPVVAPADSSEERIAATFTRWWYSHDHEELLKLMEHSFFGNKLVDAVCDYLFDNPHRLVWAGDYAKNEFDMDENLYSLTYGHPEKKAVNTAPVRADKVRWLVNHSKKQIVDLHQCPDPDKYGLRLHPLPLLTADGNGQGNGDYWGTSQFLVGSWSRDVISVTDWLSDESMLYQLVEPGFREKS